MTVQEYLTEHTIVQTSVEKYELEDLGDKLGIPIKDRGGKILFRKYRHLNHKSDSNIPKYTFDKGSSAVIFNPNALDKPNIVICEGEIDCIRLDQENIPAITGTAGASTFSKDWIELCKGKTCFICYDSDKPGQENALKVAQKLFKEGINVKIVNLPEDCKDVCNFFSKGYTKEEFIKLCENAESYKDKKIEDSTGEEEETEDKKTIVLQIVEDVIDTEAVFFHDQNKNGYVALKGDGREILKLASKPFKQWLSRYVWEHQQRIPSSDSINNVIQVLEGKAIYDGEYHELGVRVCESDHTIWYDLGDGNAVRIVKEDWFVIDKPPILFKRYTHQLPQVHPQRDGDLRDLCSFVNLTSEEEKLLFQVYAVVAFIPNLPHPLLVLHGPQGAGKTTPLKLLKSVIDPSLLKTLTAPDGIREFVQLASHHYFFFLDNLSNLPGWLSDALSRACTGDGFAKRELFSDDDDVIYSFQRSIGLNGINLVVQKADLLDRSILLGLERISKDKRREEQEFWKEFENKKPYLLGAIFDAVAKALKLYPTIQLTSRPRMADFTRWGCAIAQALGYTQEAFLAAYNQNISNQNDEAIEASPVGISIIAFMDDRTIWEGTASELLTALDKLTNNLKIDTRSRNWPKSASTLSRKLQLIHANLGEKGINVIRHDTSRPRKITIQKITENSVGADMPSGNTQNEANLASTTIEKTPLVTDIVSVGETEPNEIIATTPTVATTDSQTSENQPLEERREDYDQRPKLEIPTFD